MAEGRQVINARVSPRIAPNELKRNRVESGIFAGMAKDKALALSLRASHDVLQLIAEIDEFKGRWEALKTLSPERLRALRHSATIESIGSSTRIEGVKLTDREIETLLANLQRNAFKSRVWEYANIPILTRQPYQLARSSPLDTGNGRCVRIPPSATRQSRRTNS
jgi:hypothetical protein